MTFDYICYTDGACKGNPGPGGWGVLLRRGTEPATELFGGELLVTNNQMELAAAIEALKQVPEGSTVELFTDSEYVIKGITQWVAGWKAKGWKTAAKQPVKNKEQWEQLDLLNANRSVTWRWVKGHANDPGNERADYLANKGVPGRALQAVCAGQPQEQEQPQASAMPLAAPSEWFILNVALHDIAQWDAFQSRRFGIQPDFIISILNRSPADLDPPPVLSPALCGCPVQTFYFNDMDEPGPCAPQEFHAQQLCALLRFCQETGKNVLVHCTAGVNRSGSIARHAVTYYGARMAGTSVPTTGCELLTQLLEAAQAKLR